MNYSVANAILVILKRTSFTHKIFKNSVDNPLTLNENVENSIKMHELRKNNSKYVVMIIGAMRGFVN